MHHNITELALLCIARPPARTARYRKLESLNDAPIFTFDDVLIFVRRISSAVRSNNRKLLRHVGMISSTLVASLLYCFKACSFAKLLLRESNPPPAARHDADHDHSPASFHVTLIEAALTVRRPFVMQHRDDALYAMLIPASNRFTRL